MSGYWGLHFFEFFAHFFGRLFSGAIFRPEADELQLAILALSALSCGLLSPFLVLKRMTMFANALSHTILFGIVVAFLLASSFWGAGLFDFSTLMLGAIGAALLTAFLTEGTVRFFKLQQDGSVGLIFSTLFALGSILATLFTKNVHLGTEAVMGNIDALQLSDLRLVAGVALACALLIPLFFRGLQISSFDPSFAKVAGIRSSLFHFLLLFLTAAVSVAVFRAVGVLLVLSFLTGPYLIARKFSHRLFKILLLSPAVGVLASLLGVALSRHLLSAYGIALSTGGIVVSLIAFFALVTYLWDFYAKKDCRFRKYGLGWKEHSAGGKASARGD